MQAWIIEMSECWSFQMTIISYGNTHVTGAHGVAGMISPCHHSSWAYQEQTLIQCRCLVCRSPKSAITNNPTIWHKQRGTLAHRHKDGQQFWHTSTKQTCAFAQCFFTCAGSDKHNKIHNAIIAPMTTHKREMMKG
jgi:hypothetical protein